MTFAEKFAEELYTRERELKNTGKFNQKELEAVHRDIVRSNSFSSSRLPGSGSIGIDGPFVFAGAKYYTQEDELYMFKDESLLQINYDNGFRLVTFQNIRSASSDEYLRTYPYE